MEKFSVAIYCIICLTILSGFFVIILEKNRLELERLRRWRNKVEAVDLKKIFILKPYYGFLNRSYREKAEMEIWECISFMRNLVCVGEGTHYSADSLLEEFIRRKTALAPAFKGTLQLMRQNQTEEAFEFFTGMVATDNSREFAHLLLRWDLIDSEYLLETLITYQKNIREARFTAMSKKNETLSNLIYLPAVLNILLILLNFIYVGYFMDQMELFTLII